jgi:protein-tyrosine phosphatase
VSTPRWLDLEGTANTRDVGGLPVTGGGVVRSGALIRSDNLQDLTEADIERLLGAGLEVVVDLRTDVERAGTGPGPLTGRVRHEQLSLIRPSREMPTGAVMPDRWADGATGAYLHYLSDLPENVAAAVRAIAGPGAAIVHCAAGKDRTGVVVAIALLAVGVPREEVVADYVLTNERIEGVYRRLVAAETYSADVARIGLDAHRVDPNAMAAVLDVVDERWGGAAAYLQKAGFEDLDGLRAALVEQPVSG